MKTSRPAVLIAATVLLALNSILNLTTPLIPGPPLPVVVLSVVAGVIGLIAAVGLWNAKRWGMIVAIVIMALTAISSTPGLVVQPNPAAVIGAGVSIVLSVLVIILTLLPSARRAYA